MKYSYLVIAILPLCITACSQTQENVKNTFNEPAPISEIHERLPLSAEESMSKISSIFERHGLRIQGGFTDNLQFSTTSVKITDQMCEGQYLKEAPLPCQIKFHGILIPEKENVTILRLLYQEFCLEQHHIENKCKDSNAEKLLFSIIKQAKEN